jgi:hypothetical protein
MRKLAGGDYECMSQGHGLIPERKQAIVTGYIIGFMEVVMEWLQKEQALDFGFYINKIFDKTRKVGEQMCWTKGSIRVCVLH